MKSTNPILKRVKSNAYWFESVVGLPAAIAFMVALPSVSVAQSEEPDYTGTLEEVIVTAQRREQSLQDVSVTVNAYNRDTIRDLGISNIKDVADFTPYLQVRNTQSGTMPIVTIRGIGAATNSLIFSTSPPSSAVHADEVYLGSPALLMFNQFDLERVEVLAGPQGTLYGRNTPAGTVNYISAKPAEEFGGGVSATLGSYDTGGDWSNVEGYVTGALSETMNGRASIQYTKGDSYVNDLDGDPYDGADRFAGRLLLDWAASDSIDVLFNIHGGSDESGPLMAHLFNFQDAPGSTCNFDQGEFPTTDLVNCVGRASPTSVLSDDGTTEIPFVEQNPFNNDPFKNGTSTRDKNDISSFGASVTVDWLINDTMGLKSITAIEDATVNRVQSSGGRDIPRFFHAYQNDDVEQFSQEIQLSGDSSGLYWTTGVYYFTEDIVHDRLTRFLGQTRRPEEARTIMDATQDTLSYAVFGQVEYDLSDAFKLIAGTRYTYEEKEYDRLVSYNFQRNANFDVLDPSQTGGFNPITGNPSQRFVRQDTGPFKDDWSNVSWKLGLDYSVDPNILWFGSVSTGFKGGQFSGSSVINPPFLGDPADQETVISYEIGVKSLLLDGSLTFNASAYYYDYEDLQVFSSISTPTGNTSVLDNAEKTEIKGLDVDLAWAATDRLNFVFALALLDGEYTDFVSIDPFTGNTTDFSGAQVVDAPEIALSSRVIYVQPIDFGEITFSTEAIYTGDVDLTFRDDTASSGKFPRRAFNREAHTLINARVGWRHPNDQFGVSLWGRNLGDEVIYNNMDVGIGSVRADVDSPLSFGVDLSYDF